VTRRSLLFFVVAAGVMAGSIGVGAQTPAPAAQPAAAEELKPNDYRDEN
jgi:hypothetical protein